jgi:hypothetical protein
MLSYAETSRDGKLRRRTAPLLLRHPLRRQLAQFVVDQRQQPAGRVRIALPQRAKECVTSFFNRR